MVDVTLPTVNYDSCELLSTSTTGVESGVEFAELPIPFRMFFSRSHFLTSKESVWFNTTHDTHATLRLSFALQCLVKSFDARKLAAPRFEGFFRLPASHEL